jgi:hypothetical protein
MAKCNIAVVGAVMCEQHWLLSDRLSAAKATDHYATHSWHSWQCMFACMHNA